MKTAERRVIELLSNVSPGESNAKVFPVAGSRSTPSHRILREHQPLGPSQSDSDVKVATMKPVLVAGMLIELVPVKLVKAVLVKND